MLKFLSTMITPPSEDRKGWKYVQPETGHVMQHLQFQELFTLIRRHREAHQLDLSAGWKERVEAAMCLYTQAECGDPANPSPYVSETAREGRKLWKELHDKGLSLPETLAPMAQKELQGWLRAWELRIPSWGGCACRQHWFEAKVLNEPSYHSGGAFYAWSVRMHDVINGLLGKPKWDGQQ